MENVRDGGIPDICNFFSTEAIFGSIFLHTKDISVRSVTNIRYEQTYAFLIMIHMAAALTLQGQSGEWAMAAAFPFHAESDPLIIIIFLLYLSLDLCLYLCMYLCSYLY